MLTISDIQDNFKILKADSNFALTKTKSIADFIKTMKKWDGGLLLNGIPFKNSKTLNWNPETYNAFLFFKGLNTLENLDKKIIDAVKQQFIYSQIPELFDEWQRIKKEHKCQSFNDMILSVHRAVMEKSADGSDSGLCKKLRS